jgi:hypothetical protein
LASIGVNDRAQAIATIIVLAATITPPQLLSFAMISMGIENQVDMYGSLRFLDFYGKLTDPSGLANGLASTFRLMGGAVATAIYSAILANTFAEKLPGKMAPVIAEYNIPQSVQPDLLQAAALNTADAYAAVSGINDRIIAAASMAVKSVYVSPRAFEPLLTVDVAVQICLCGRFQAGLPGSTGIRWSCNNRGCIYEDHTKREENDAAGDSSRERKRWC